MARLGSSLASRMQELHHPSLRQNQALLATIALSFLMLLGSAWLTVHVSRQGVKADQRVFRTFEVQRALNATLIALGGAESGLRGYLLTGNEAFLAPHREAGEALPRQLARLRELVRDDAVQADNVEAVAPLIQQRVQSIDDALAAHREGRREEVVAALERSGLPTLNQIRTRLEAMGRLEQDLLERRLSTVSALRERFVTAVIVLLIACGTLALFALVSVRRYVAAVQDSQRQLAAHNLALERRVQERTQELAQSAEAANRERARAESLLTDVNHRVGNNLALVSSFLTMQQRVVRNPHAARALAAARARVQAIASAHRKLRLGADFATVKVSEVLGAVLDDIGAGLPPGEVIQIHRQVEPLEINARDAVSLGVLTSELVMNAVKHAFDAGQSGEIIVTLRRGEDAVPVLEVTDDGIGWDEERAQDPAGLGAKIIDMVARQFGGQPERSALREGPRPGTRMRVHLANLQTVSTSSTDVAAGDG
jgi:two-component sensor histidine kinase/CHASE3 domain sensor protein